MGSILKETLLELKRIYYTYDGAHDALTDLSVRICRGERIAVIGNNGAGKSTFFLICNGVLRPQKGEVMFFGRQVNHRNKQDLMQLRKHVGIVFQDADNQLIASTVPGEISFGPMNLGLQRNEVQERVNDAIFRMQLQDYVDRAPQNLSGGEKKRVSIADILAMRPDIILFDEPTASLDPQNSRLLEQTLDELSAAGITVVISTHDMDLALRFSERVLVFSDGKLARDGSPEEVFDDGALLFRAGLEKPLLYEVAELLQIKERPRSIEALRETLQN